MKGTLTKLACLVVVGVLIALGVATRPTPPAVERVAIEYRVDVPQAQGEMAQAPSVADETLAAVVESYVDISEDNNEAMIALATEDMRARENRQAVMGMVGLLVAFALVFIVGTSLPWLRTLILARSVPVGAYSDECWKVRE